MKQRHLVALKDLSRADMEEVFDLARRMKADKAAYRNALAGQTLAMIFEKSSTRTRVSFEVGMYQLGGIATFLSSRDIQIGRGEPISDTAKVLSRYVRRHHGADLRARDVDRAGEVRHRAGDQRPHRPAAPVPGARRLLHGAREVRPHQGLTLAYVGDGNNMCHSLMFGGAEGRHERTVATPEGYRPNAGDRRARRQGRRQGRRHHGRGRRQAARRRSRAPTSSTPTCGPRWARRPRRRCASRRSPAYQVTPALMEAADKEAVFMHCLPGPPRRGGRRRGRRRPAGR